MHACYITCNTHCPFFFFFWRTYFFVPDFAWPDHLIKWGQTDLHAQYTTSRHTTFTMQSPSLLNSFLYSDSVSEDLPISKVLPKVSTRYDQIVVFTYGLRISLLKSPPLGGSRRVINFPWICVCNAEFSPCWALPEYIRALIHLACLGVFSVTPWVIVYRLYRARWQEQSDWF